MIGWIVHLAQSYPELVAVVVGLIAAVLFGETLRRLWFPQTWSRRDCWRALEVVDFLIAFGFTTTLWHGLDHDRDSHGLVFAGSLAVGLCAVGVHWLVLAFAHWKFPALDPDGS